MVELLRAVILNVLESLESGDGYAVCWSGLASSEGCGLRGNEAERELGMGNG